MASLREGVNTRFMNPSPSPDSRAYLVVRHGGRWSDVLRLTAALPAVIGRASDCAVTIRSHQASRRHAEIRWHDSGWWIRDLGSRNGTRVGGRHLHGSGADAAAPLAECDLIEIAGFQMLFTGRLDNALQAAPPSDSSTGPASDDQLTLDGIDLAGNGATQVAQRLGASRYLPHADGHWTGAPTAVSSGGEATAAAWKLLFQLAYRLAACNSVREAAETTLDLLAGAIPAVSGAVYLPNRLPPRIGTAATTIDSDLVAFRTPPQHSYQRPSAELQSIGRSGTQAVLLRHQDAVLPEATAATGPMVSMRPSGSIGDLVSDNGDVVLAPITSWGHLYLYNSTLSVRWDSEQLELAAAAAAVLGAALDSLSERGRLLRSLKRSRRTVDSLRQRVDQAVQIIGTSPAIAQVHEVIHRVAQTDTTVLVCGESGVGKELVAGAIHQASDRRDGPLVCLNCAALSPTLLESELFGHEKGAFTGATEQKRGKFELADGGTLMLDEIGEMDVPLQAKLLRVLEGHPFERLGGHQPIRCDVRLIAATNRDLEAEVATGRFRADLFYRLHVVEIVVPPLRKRPSDIALLANHFANHFADKTARSLAGITKQAHRVLAEHTWPGNVRELKNTIERAVVLGSGPWIDVSDLALPAPIAAGPTAAEQTATVATAAGRSDAADTLDSPPLVPAGPPLAAPAGPLLSLEELERQHLLAVLKSTHGNKSKAAAILGIERSTLDRKLKRYEQAKRQKNT